MDKRGYIKPVGGHTRMRFVQSGYDPDDMTVPPNKVIFDSDDVGTLALVTAGMYRFSGGSGAITATKIVTWDLDFVPLCSFQFDINEYGRHNYTISPPNSGGNFYIKVDRTGITAQLFKGTGTLDVYYTAYRLAAQ